MYFEMPDYGSAVFKYAPDLTNAVYQPYVTNRPTSRRPVAA
jgi:hypothetical protein